MAAQPNSLKIPSDSSAFEPHGALHTVSGGGKFTTFPTSNLPGNAASPSDQWWNVLLGLLGLSSLLPVMQHYFIFDSVKLLFLGSIIETGRRLCMWLFQRFRFQYSITAQFDEGDPSFDWILHFLTEENVWRRSRDFRVSAKSSTRKWAVDSFEEGGPGKVNAKSKHADFVPTYELPQLFRWRGHFMEIRRNGNVSGPSAYGAAGSPGGAAARGGGGSIWITIYTLHMPTLSALVEEARERYLNVTKPNVIIHLADTPSYGPEFIWTSAKHKARRPLESIILPEGLLTSLIEDAREFIASEDWYVSAGIPHRRGYLLYGPPGSGKTSTIYALAGALSMEIYSLSLASSYVDDSFLNRAASSVPKNSILLIEDIDCAFPSREELEFAEEQMMNPTNPYNHQLYFGVGNQYGGAGNRQRSAVTLSGLLNCLDGVASEEGKLFFATTNYVDRLDAALLRPGRIDKKVEYKLATPEQAEALFKRFFPPSSASRFKFDSESESKNTADTEEKAPSSDDLSEYASRFASQIPSEEFSTAELQGYLLSKKKDPRAAVEYASEWIEAERRERREKEAREAERKRKIQERKEKYDRDNKFGGLGSAFPGLGGPMLGASPGAGLSVALPQEEKEKGSAEAESTSEAGADTQETVPEEGDSKTTFVNGKV